MCEEWEKSFESFYEWAIQNGYTDELSIDRVNNDKGYSPDNCQWVPLREQQKNRSTARLITYHGDTKTITEWAEETGLGITTINERIKRGWNEEEIFSEKTRKQKHPNQPKTRSHTRQIVVDGVSRSIAETARVYGVDYNKLCKYVQRGTGGDEKIKNLFRR